MRFAKYVVILFATTFAIGIPQSQFVGKWQSRASRGAHKSAITVKIIREEQGLSGTVVLVNPDASELELPILNLKVNDSVIEFETHDKGGTFYWSLTLQNSDRALLHGNCKEMLIDERMRRQH